MIELHWLETTTDERWAAVARLHDHFATGHLPMDRPIPASELHARVLHSPAHRTDSALLALDADDVVGAAMLAINDLKACRAWLPFLFVVPTHRRYGIGTLLLDEVRERASAAGRRTIQTRSLTGDAAAAAFARRCGLRAGLIVEQSRCPISALNEAELGAWVTRAAERAGAYSLVTFDGVCPDEHLDAFAAVLPVMNTAPQAGESEDVVPSPDQVRENMAAHVRQGNESWTVCARHDPSGRFVGYTELSLSDHRPWHATQGDTGVDPAHRKRGIGRWLKARTALRLLAEHPEVDHIETWNAGANATMLSINRAMGFRAVARWQEWEFPA